MKIDILSLFPEFFSPLLSWSIIGRACEENKVSINSINIREFSQNKHKKVDDYPFGGGRGMVMKPEPIFRAIKSVRDKNSRVIYLSPQGKKFNQELANELSKEEHLILLCGHYEGIDNRIIEHYIDEEISIGDFVLTGGEIPAMIIIDAIVRLLPGVLRSDESFTDESHYNGLLEYPQYTRPREFNGYSVPDILLSGNHGKIETWRKEESLKATLLKRPDLLKQKTLSEEELIILSKIKDNLQL
ncbi:tRNA (guanosine(37)-N1)-methyltransferase TrmD [Tissierella praeacuta]|uniref:tRNA (guanine-N(1)-)-methyltransferase n=1 Tax=Tissierella praeacuta DSM 18095 TaxID=1123404 RepID=A0A1M4SN90_9FIRM|nr:tRNA (guanosine(37)-N1)-methyltransferase TrmD [Tissierella praeacuta]SHE33639.1 tRNA (guanine37-N1)-methyltransferase [Tissierella praeacuta DSM 18095]SUP01590.1 tRNA (guanine-N(1)-)-methyltransferase [Tissierella praeacuta]